MPEHRTVRVFTGPDETPPTTTLISSASSSWPTGAIDLSGDHVEYTLVSVESSTSLYGVRACITAIGLAPQQQIARASIQDLTKLVEQLQTQRVWTPSMDAQLVDWVNTHVEKTGIDSTMSSMDLKPSDLRIHPSVDAYVVLNY